jgi:hypothetical protein
MVTVSVQMMRSIATRVVSGGASEATSDVTSITLMLVARIASADHLTWSTSWSGSCLVQVIRGSQYQMSTGTAFAHWSVLSAYRVRGRKMRLWRGILSHWCHHVLGHCATRRMVGVLQTASGGIVDRSVDVLRWKVKVVDFARSNRMNWLSLATSVT